ncbi:MAG: nascent polypeptide-associated complex protein [Candidatus Woesearchaeota archaeon]|jgi:nascent polypeptide-associated complex subunit alpha
MLPGMGGIDPRMMKQAMKRMGVEEKEIPNVQEVIIRLTDKDIIISQAQVSKVTMMGNVSWQVQGTATEYSKNTKPDISQEDIQTVMDQTNVDEEIAKQAIEKNNGDLAAAILELTK